MRVVVIGGTGHIGTYLTPALVEAGHTVTCVSRGLKQPYTPHPAWKGVHHLQLDRDAEEKAGRFGDTIVRLDADAVVDLTCYHPSSAEQIATVLRGTRTHLLHCGTIWVHGHSEVVPTTEDQSRRPFGDYGIRKAAIEQYLLDQMRANKQAITILHPGHLVGPGWAPVNPAANFNLQVFADLRHGREILLPNLGMETLHHVHAADVAACFVLAIHNRDQAAHHSFHVVSSSAITLRGYAERMADHFNQPRRLSFLPWEEWRTHNSEKDARATWDHIAHSPHCSIGKAQARLGYKPRYTSLEAVYEAVDSLIGAGMIA